MGTWHDGMLVILGAEHVDDLTNIILLLPPLQVLPHSKRSELNASMRMSDLWQAPRRGILASGCMMQHRLPLRYPRS